MIKSASANQISMVLNFALSVGFRFANAEPIVRKTMANNMSIMCINPKKVDSKSVMA